MRQQVTHISSGSNARVKALVKLRRQRARRRTGLFIADGLRQVTRALEAGLVLRQLYRCSSMLDAVQLPPVPPDAEQFEVTSGVFTKLAYCENPQGIVGVFEQRCWTFEQVTVQAPPAPQLWLVSIGATKPGNVGAMARSAEAAGATGLVLADSRVDPYNPNAIRSSTGAVFTLPIIIGSSQSIIDRFMQQRTTIIAADPNTARRYTDVDMTGPVALVVGGEDQGLGPDWCLAAQRGDLGRLVQIPMFSQTVDSLNASAVAAVLLFEALRQRHIKR